MATAQDLREAILEGAAQRERPVMMTVAAIIGGLLPIMWTTGTGADVMKRIAAPMIGGMVSSTILTVVVIPVLYFIWKRRIMRSDSPIDTTFASPRRPNRCLLSPHYS
jgi:copper/silver efflux system protein